MRSILLSLALVFGVSGCRRDGSSVAAGVSHLWFSSFGTSLSSDVHEIALKELHLSVDSLLGRTVIVRGPVVEFGEQGTYAVIGDDTSKLLISLAGAGSSGVLISEKVGHREFEFSFMGTLEVGKRGLPFLVASSVYSRKLALADGGR